nr:MAG TPA: hypothetical protein [Siphoviridae sp. ctwYi19]
MKILKPIKTKKELFSLYLSQYSEKNIRAYINDIIKQYRPKANAYCKNVSSQEFLTFVELYGLPNGYILSEELQNEIKTRKLKV